MSMEQELERAIRLLVKNSMPAIVSEGTVLRVDKEKRTCDVDREDLADLTDVRLNSILEAGDDVLTVYPQKGSRVICLVIGNDASDAFVISTNDIEEVSGQIGEMKLLWNKDGVVLNDGENGGLVKLQELTDNLNSLKDFVMDLHKALPTAFIAVKAGSAADGPGGATAYSNSMSGKSIDIQAMENEKIKH